MPVEPQRVFIRPDRTALVTCPHCSFTQTATVDRAIIKKHLITVRCKCGQVFAAQLESRGHFRKPAAIRAFFRNLTKEAEADPKQGYSTIARYGSDERWPGPNCTITNISERGMGLRISGERRIDKGDILQIEFALDNVARTEVVQKVVVRRVFGSTIGTEFIEESKYQVTLSFYING